MAAMDIRVKVTGSMDEGDREAMARFMGMEGEPIADIREAFAEWVAGEAWTALASAVGE